MFSYETEHIIRKIQNRILGTRDSVTLRLILSAPVHDAIKVYFRASVADKHGSTKRFHTEHTGDIESIQSDIDLLLPSNYTFNKDTFTSLLTDAVHFQFNYLCRPRWTMKEFFFHNSSSLTVPELKQGFLYFSAYNYYPKVFFRYLQKKHIHEVARDEFDGIILKIDKLVLGDATPDDFANLLLPLANFIAYGREDGDDSIPEHAIALFFGDKGFNHIRHRLESTLQSRHIEKVTIDELRTYLSEMPVEDTAQEEITDPVIEPGDTKDQIPSELPPVEMDIDGDTEEPEEAIDENDTGRDTSLADLEHLNIEETEEREDIFEKEAESQAGEEEPPVVEEPFEEEPLEEEPDTLDSPEESEMREEPENKIEPEHEPGQKLESAYEEEETEDQGRYDDEDLFRPIQREPETTDETGDEPEEELPSEDVHEEEKDDEELYEEESFREEPIEDESLEEKSLEEEPMEDEPLEEEPLNDEHFDEEQFDEEQDPSKRPSSTMPPLDLLIEEDERKRFIRKLFNGDSAYFNIVVQTLNKMTSWKEASLYIDEIFLMNGVDPYSTDSVNFTDKVYTRFSHKSKYR